MNIFLHIGDAAVTASFYLGLHTSAATNVKCLSPSNLGRKQTPNKNCFMTHRSYLWCRAAPGPLSSAVTPVLPQHEGGDAVGRASSAREQGLPVLALRCVKHHHALSSRLCWNNLWDKGPGGSRAIDMALASNLGLLRAHCWVHAKTRHFLLFYYFNKIKIISAVR